MNTLSLHSIFHPSDFSKGDENAFAHALKLALAAKAELTVLHVGEPGADVHWYDFPSVRETLSNWRVQDVSNEGLAKSGLRVKKVMKTGRDSARAVIDYAAEHYPNLIVLATHQRQGLTRLLHRAMAEPIARNTHVLTLFVPRQVAGFVSRQDGSVSLRNVVIPIDHSPPPQRAADAAAALAQMLECPQTHFHFLYVGEEEDLPKVTIPNRQGWSSETSTWKGQVVDHILKVSQARNADLIVMATAGHHGFLDALRGTTTEQVLRQAPCPILAVPA